jgi:hypothetical protein
MRLEIILKERKIEMTVRAQIISMLDTLKVSLQLMGPVTVIFLGCAVLTVLSVLALLAEILVG